MSQYPTPPAEHQDWTQATLTELADHLETTHHAYTREALARLTDLVNAVIARHGPHHPELFKLRTLFRDFRDELVFHLLKEEQTLFPWIRRIEQAPTAAGTHPEIDGLVRLLEREHDHGNHLMASMDPIVKGLQVPAETPGVYHDLVLSLADLQADLRQHVYEEDDVLFPKVLALYERLQSPR
ncbi:MAG TPA: hemerythrin domain-containing protein [Tepidisphaeraceae bacterium]|nr:hemerythrin domain-containing protein [Tepidisphaeraceae bacterium]